jgi:L-alanine-DL-glutamate epimerase-like enolase superfamily enzyme
MRTTLHRATLHYGGGLILHTASSGPVAGLDTLYLCLEDGDHAGVGEVRINIAYLNGIPSETIEREAIALFDSLDWSLAAERLLSGGDEWRGASAPVRMLLDCALHDLIAKQAGVPLANRLGADAVGPPTYPTNQTLFISSDEHFMAQAESYVNRGFCDLKVRVGSGDFSEDCRRLATLRTRFGDGVKLAVDANGAWTVYDAQEKLAELARFDLAYVEQPVAPGDWDALNRLGEQSPIPLMLDEGVSTATDIDAIIAAGGRLWAHLKLVKLGGLTPALKAAQQLRAADIPFMIGQMNEGGVATAAALHLAVATEPRFAELYGADGLTDDPASGLAYAEGRLYGNGAAGLGMTFDASKTRHIREFGA